MAHTSVSRIPPALRRRSLRAIYSTAVFGMAGNACLSPSVMSLAIIELGGTELHLSLLQFVWLAPLVFGILTLTLVERWGKKPVLVGGYAAYILFVIPILFLPALVNRWSPGQCIWLILTSLFLMSVAGALGVAGWFPLLQDNVPRRLSGRFFGSFRTSWQVASLVMLLSISFYLGQQPDWNHYQWVFVAGFAAYVARAISFCYVAELRPRPGAHPAGSAWTMVREFATDRSLYPMMTYLVSYAVALTLCESFKIKLLKELGYSEGVILGAVAMLNVGGILSLRTWGRLADRYGNRFIFGISHIAMSVITLLWIAVGRGALSLILVYGLHLLHAVFNGGNYLAQSRYLLSAVPAGKPSRLTMINNLAFVVWGIAPALGALFLWLLERWSLTVGPVRFDNYDLLFALSAGLFLIPHRLRWRLGLDNETPTLHVMTLVTRPIINTLYPFIRYSEREERDDPPAAS